MYTQSVIDKMAPGCATIEILSSFDYRNLKFIAQWWVYALSSLFSLALAFSTLT
jgi:hypothetical protein